MASSCFYSPGVRNVNNCPVYCLLSYIVFCIIYCVAYFVVSVIAKNNFLKTQLVMQINIFPKVSFNILNNQKMFRELKKKKGLYMKLMKCQSRPWSDISKKFHVYLFLSNIIKKIFYVVCSKKEFK